jgi:hypothetical protein
LAHVQYVLIQIHLDENLIEGVLEFYGFSLYVRGVCQHVELVRQTDQLCTLLVKTLHRKSESPVVLRVTVDQIIDDWKVDGGMFETFLI